MKTASRTFPATSSLTMTLAAGLVLVSGALTGASAATVYFAEGVSFREAKRMCNDVHGKVFQVNRSQYGCVGELVERKYLRKPPPATHVEPTSTRPVKIMNFRGRTESELSNIKIGGEGNGNGGGGGGNGGKR